MTLISALLGMALEGWRIAHRENQQGVSGSEQVITLQFNSSEK